jgi:hypothetical protein
MAKNLSSFRRRAFLQQGGCCFYCQQPIWEANAAVFAAKHKIPPRQVNWLRSTAEHVIALCDGGTDCTDNIVAACHWCNSRRHRGRQDRAPGAAAYCLWVRRMVAAGKWHPVIESRTRSAAVVAGSVRSGGVALRHYQQKRRH